LQSFLLIFLDGVGIGLPDKKANPFFEYPFKTFTKIFGKIPEKDKITFTLYSDSVSINSHQYEFKTKFLTKIYEKNSRKLNYLYKKIFDGNILRLKGVITKPLPIMIFLERGEGGLKEGPPCI